MNNWYNEGAFKCEDCDIIFKAYFLNDEGTTSFCPNCSSRNITDFEEDEE